MHNARNLKTTDLFWLTVLVHDWLIPRQTQHGVEGPGQRTPGQPRIQETEKERKGWRQTADNTHFMSHIW